MKAIIKWCVCVLFLATMTGCVKYRTHPRGIEIRQAEVTKFSTTQPVALYNTTVSGGESVVGSWGGWTVFGDRKEYTASCIDTLERALAKWNIKTADTAAKTLQLNIYDAQVTQGMWTFQATTRLEVKTGSGLSKKYEGRQNYANGYSTTPAVEKALSHCIELMLNDADIVNYLKY